MSELVSKDKATSLVWNYFGFEAGEDGKPINSEKAICRIATGCRKKPVLAKGGNTSNLLTHLKRHHHKQYAELIEAQEKKKSKENGLKASQGQTKLKAVEQSAAKYVRGSKKWQELTDSVSFCIAKDMMPMYTVEKEGFKALLKSFDSKYEVPSRKYFSQTALPALYAKTREAVSNELDEVRSGGYFAATTDLWSSSTSEPFISYTVHFINHNWELCSRSLQTMFMPEQHTGENIAEAIQATLEAWGLQEAHQVCLTSDSGSNVVNAAKRLQMTRLACFGHNLHLGVTNALKDDYRLSRTLGVCKKIVSSFSYSWKKKSELSKVQSEMKLPQHSLITVGITIYLFSSYIAIYNIYTTNIIQCPHSTQGFT